MPWSGSTRSWNPLTGRKRTIVSRAAGRMRDSRRSARGRRAWRPCSGSTTSRTAAPARCIWTRYYAEPTTKFGTSTGLHGASLVKGNTPYPIFLPHLAESLIETFRFFDGAARLERLGADVSAGTRADVKNNHGSWGLVPASLGLVALQVPQGARLGTGQTELPAYERWKRQRHAGYSTSWMYGGSELLFYRADGNTPGEAVTNIDGLDCRIWRDARLGMHSRDLYGLADTIEAGGVTETVEA